MWVPVIILGFFLFGPSRAENSGNCQITGITELNWNVVLTPEERVYDNENNKLIFQSPYTGTLEDLKCNCTANCNDKHEYLSISNNDTDFVITTSDHITDLDEDTPNPQTNPYIQINYGCEMTCANGASSLNIMIAIYDYNNHKPKFTQDSYSYKVASPIMPVTDFTLYGVQIEASDLDFSNTNMSFSVEPNHFDIFTTVNANDPKSYIANVRATQVISLTETATYQLTAKDSGTDPQQLSVTVPITIEIDESKSFDTPFFQYSDSSLAAYTFQYEDNDTLTPLSGAITLNTRKVDSIADIQLLGELKDNFKYEFDKTSKTFSLSVNPKIENPTSPSTVLTLSLKTDSETSTPIIIYFSDVPSNAVSFSQHSYTGTYDDAKNEVTLDQDIKVTSSGEPIVTPSGDLADHFSLTYDTTKKTYSVKVDKALTVDEIKSKPYLNLVLTATLDSDSDTSNLIIKLPSHTLEFTEVLYTATYNDDNTVTVDQSKPIAFTGDVAGVGITVEETYSDYFKVNDKNTIDVSKPLPSDILTSQTELAVILTAKDAYNNQPQAVVKISLPLTENIEAPKFSKPYYVVQYAQDQTGYIDFTDPISFDNVKDPTAVSIALSTYPDNFEVVYNNKTWRLHVKTALDSNIFDSNSELIITAEATETGITAKGVGVLVIELKKSIAPQFSNSYYVATYTEGQTGYMDFNQDVSFSNVDDPTKLSIVLSTYQDNFEITYDNSKKTWRIAIKTPLDADTFDANTEIVTTMIATEAGVKGSGEVLLVIELKSEDSPEFSEPYYRVQYTEGQTGYIDFNPDLSFKNIDDPTKVVITLSTYGDNFEVLYDKQTKKWRINIKKALDTDIFDTTTEIVTKMEATETGVTKKGEGVLVVELKTTDTEVEPKFSLPYYVVQYTEGQTGYLDFKTDVAFSNVDDPSKITIVLSTYEENFDVIYDKTTKKWRINIKKPLDTDTFDTISEIVTKMEATETGIAKKGEGVLVIELKTTDTEIEPKFSDLYYVVQYTEGQTGNIDFNTPLSFKNVDDPTKVTIALSTYQENFEVIYDTTLQKWHINIKEALDTKIFDSVSEIVATMEATETGVTRKGEGVLVIELKATNTEVEPKFSDLYYVVQYTEGQTGYLDFKTDVAFSNVDDPSKITIVLSTYEENFDVIYDKTTKKWRINIKKPLDTDTFDTISEIVTKMEATETGIAKKGEGVLVIELKTTDTEVEPKFSQPYYVVQYTEGQTGNLDFKTNVSFSNVDDPSEITIVLSTYQENFDVVYDKTLNKWRLSIKKSLDTDVFDSISEIVTTMQATETGVSRKGDSVLVIELKTNNTEVEPKFSDLYYVVQYTEGQTGYLDFKTDVAFSNVDDATKITIVLSTYEENFDVIYDKPTKKWRINIKKPLDTDTFDTISEIVTKMEATETGIAKKGDGVLVIELKSTDTEVEPKFSEPYYIVQYTEGQTGNLDFNTPLSFKNVDDPTKVTIALSTYQENFEVIYDTTLKKWHINIKEALDTKIFDSVSEIVATMEATETGVTRKGEGVLVIELKATNTEVEPKFSDPYYVAQYTEGQTGLIDFKPALSFANVDDPLKITIALSTYSDNFEIVYDKTLKRWRINIKKVLDTDVFGTMSEIVTTMEASEAGVTKKGVGVLVIELKPTDTDIGPTFSDSYYVVQYTDGQTGYIEFENAVSFSNVDDLTKVSIALSNYNENFEIVYNSNKFRVQIKKAPDSSIFDTNAELITNMEATQSGISKTGTSVLVIQLVGGSVDAKVPKFEKTYYTAEYPKSGTGTIPFEQSVIVDNVDDISKLTITIPGYTDNFEVSYDKASTKWLITILKPLDDATLSTGTYLTATLSAKIEGDNKHTPTSAFVLKLPEQEVAVGPIFSKSYYKAVYGIEGTTATVHFDDEIGFSSNVDVNNIQIVSDEYSDNFSFNYDENSKTWTVQTGNILDINALNRTDLVVSITATDSITKLTGHSIIDLKLPNVNTESAPKFSKTYYTAKYEIGADKSTVTLDEPLEILNKDDISKISITIDKYADNFAISNKDGAWVISVSKNLDQSILNSKVDIVMALIATDSTDTESIGQSALVISLPVINNDEAPKFSSISYESQCDSKSTVLDTHIKITNKDDLTKIAVKILEDDYKSNFDIALDATTSSWLVTVNSLPEAAKTKNDLVLTLTAIEDGNKNIGQGVLVLNFPVLEAPKFSSNQYFGSYNQADTAVLTVEDVKIDNKDDQTNIKLNLVFADGDFSKNFDYTFDTTKNIWKITLKQPFNSEDIKDKSELIFTLSATEDGNDKVGYATVIISLLNKDDNTDLSFSGVHYEGEYDSSNPEVALNEAIKLTSNKDVSSAVVLFEISEDFDPTKYFKIVSAGATGTYKVSVSNPLPKEILEKQRSLAVTLEASLNTIKSYATLVINLPVAGAENSIDFSKILYDGKYSLVDDKVTFTYEDITIVTDEDSSDITVSICKDSTYASYFTVTQENKVVTLTVSDIPIKILSELSVIPITLTASSTGTTKTGSAVVNINIDYNTNKGTVQFNSALYNGAYEIKDGVGTATFDPITLTTDQADDVISVVLENYKEYFNSSYKSNEVTLTKTKNIPASIYNDISTVSILLTASIKNNPDVKSQTVVNLRIINDDSPTPDVTGKIIFNNVLNTAQYSVEDGTGVFQQDADIGVTTDRKDDEVETSISEGSDLQEYFRASYKNKAVTISLEKVIPDSIFRSRPIISLTLEATIKGTTESTFAVLNIRLNNDGVVDTGHVSFSDTVYNGKYDVKDDKAVIDYDEITVDTDQGDDNIIAFVEEPYSKYFEVLYTNKVMKITLIVSQATSDLRSMTNVPVVITAQIKNTAHVATAVVNFKVTDYDNGGSDDSSVNFDNLVYSGEYNVGNHTFKTEPIRLISDYTEVEIEVEITNEYNYQNYFTWTSSHGVLTISLKEALPQEEVEKLGFIAMSLKVNVKNKNTIHGAAVLNIKINRPPIEDEDMDHTGYIIAISILAVLIFLLIAGTLAFYFFKFRNSKYKRMTEEEYMNSKVRFDKSALKRTSSAGRTQRSSAIEERRPTGFIFNANSPLDEEEPRDSSTDPTDAKERKKSVAFDENVEKLKIETINDADIDKALDADKSHNRI